MVNESVYGARNTWITLKTDSTIKFANFGDNSARISKGFSTEKLKLNKPYNNSIVHSALGNESALSRFKTFKGAEELSTENFNELLWSFACGTSVFNPVPNSSTNNTTNMLSPLTNSYISNSDTHPVVNFAYNSLRAVIRVYARESENGRTIDRSLHEYCTEYANEYPYITRVYLDMYEKVNNSWSKMTTYGYLGILIHNTTNYFSHTHAPSKTFTNGVIGNVVCAEYGSGANVPEITILGLLSQRLSDNRIYTTDISIVSGDLVVSSDVDGRGIFHIDYYEGFEEYCKRQTACFGIQFVTSSQYATVDIESPEVTDEELNNVFIGVLDESYIGHGDYVNGERIFDVEQYDKTAEEVEYNPNIETSDFGDLETDSHNIVGGNGGHTIYNLTESNMANLIKWANSEESGETGQNYMNYITSVKFSPLGFHNRGIGEETVKINGHLVNVGTTAVKGVKAFRSDSYTSNSITISRYFNDFRDFEPYTSISLKLPFSESVKLPCAEWYGHNLRVVFTVDEIGGTGVAKVYKDELIWLTLNCNTAIDVPLTVLNSGTYHNTLIQAKTTRDSALIGVGLSAVGVGGSIASGNYLGATMSTGGLVGSVEALKQSEYNLTHATKPIAHIGGTGDITNFTMSWYPQIVIERPEKFNLSGGRNKFDFDNYANTVGYACCKPSTINKEKGFVVVNNIDLSNCTLTEGEKNEIISLLTSGIIK